MVVCLCWEQSERNAHIFVLTEDVCSAVHVHAHFLDIYVVMYSYCSASSIIEPL